MGADIPLDAGAIMSTALEGILYGKQLLRCSRAQADRSPRVFLAYVLRHRLGVGIRTGESRDKQTHVIGGDSAAPFQHSCEY